MKKTGVIGVGNMGSGLAKNLIANGFETWGYDLIDAKTKAVKTMGGHAATGRAEVGRNCDAVFVMVMHGDQARDVILGKEGLVHTMKKGGTVILSATIKPAEARAIGEDMKGTGIDLIDTPVSGGFPGAQAGTLTLMAAAPADVLDRNHDVLDAVSGTIHRVGTEPGEGQTVKACLQSLIGAIFSATFEASVLAAKSGVPGQVLFDVFSTSAAGCGIVKTALENTIDRKFEGTGSHIDTMHKDLTISLDLAEVMGVPLHTASTAMQIFTAGRSKFPNGDNQACARVMEQIVGAELHR